MESKQFVAVQHSITDLLNTGKLKDIDIFVYATIRKFYDVNTKMSVVSINQIRLKTGVSYNMIDGSLERLKSSECITSIDISHLNKKIKIAYVPKPLLKDDRFERFMFKLLDDEALTVSEKTFVIMCRRYLLQDNESEQLILKYSYKELAGILMMDYRTVQKRLHTLISKGYVSQKLATIKDGNNIIVYDFNKEELGLFLNTVVKKVKQHDDEIEKMKKELKELQEFKRMMLLQSEEKRRVEKLVIG